MFRRRNSSPLWLKHCIKAFITLKGQFVFLEKASSYFLSLSSSNPKGNKNKQTLYRLLFVLKVPFCTFISTTDNVIKQLKISMAELMNMKLWKHQAPKLRQLFLLLIEARGGLQAVCEQLQSPVAPCRVLGLLFRHHLWKPCQSSQHAEINLNLGVCSNEIQLFWPQVYPGVSGARISSWLETLLLCQGLKVIRAGV